MTTHDVLIVGGGHAGAQAAISLRQAGFAHPATASEPADDDIILKVKEDA